LPRDPSRVRGRYDPQAMGHRSDPLFCTLHSLRIKGFATVDTLVDLTQHPNSVVEAHLGELASRDEAQFREARALWQLTAVGRERHAEQLRSDVAPVLPNATFSATYAQFIRANEQFKELCGAWQLVDGRPNDHSDPEWDAAVLENLAHLHSAVEPLLATFGDAFERMAPYGQRLESVLIRVQDGESNMFTGVMCGSYHDVWMELHEDLILTQGIDRNVEGSF
jgi:hypothetical protein